MTTIEGYRRIGFLVLGAVLLISIVGGVLSIIRAGQYSAAQQQIVTFENDLIKKARLIYIVQDALGYGGFIHNFKNYVLRGEPRFKQRAEADYATIISALDAYRRYPLNAEEHSSLDRIEAVVMEYDRNLARIDGYIADGHTAEELDRLVQVDDAAAVAALQRLNGVWEQRFADRVGYLADVLDVAHRGARVVQVAVVVLMAIAVIMFWWGIRYEKAWRQALREQRISDAKYREIIANSGDAIITIDNKGLIETFNHTASKLFGYTEEEVLGKNVSMLLPADERVHHDGYIANSSTYHSKVINSVRGLQACRKDGSLFPIELNIAPYFVEGKKAYAGMLRDITEKKKSEEMLLQSMKTAIDANAAKNMFIANMNHELRTPLNAIIGYSDMMRMELFGKMPSEKYIEYAEDINGAGHHLLSVISDILDISAVEEGKLALNKQVFRLAEIVNDSLKIIMRQAEENGIAVKYDPTDFDVALNADAKRMKQVLLNILDNSIKFTLRGGVISMTCVQDEDSVVLSVDDTGVGVSEQDITLIFEPFQQARETHLTAKKGAGLGLPLSRNLVELHGGTMEFFSEVGKGSRVVIRLPKNPVLSAA